jgi:hypothetical protein
MLSQFKNFTADRLELDDLVALSAFGESLRAAYEKHQLEEPAFVDVQLKSLRREILGRNADRLEARRKEITQRLDRLKSPDQRRADLEQEKLKIEEQLAKV